MGGFVLGFQESRSHFMARWEAYAANRDKNALEEIQSAMRHRDDMAQAFAVYKEQSYNTPKTELVWLQRIRAHAANMIDIETRQKRQKDLDWVKFCVGPHSSP
jgi:hypothetical protein